MKLTDIDLSSLAEVAAAVTLLEHVHRELATGSTPLPSLPPACQESVVSPAAGRRISFAEAAGTVAEDTKWCMDLAGAMAANDAPRNGPGIDPVSPGQTGGLDAASVFGGAPARGAASLPPAPFTAGVTASPTAPAAPPASGAPPTPPAPAPLPAPSAAASTVPAVMSGPASGADLDTDGLPWDERIHAGTKRKNADGRWTSKRGVNDPDLVPRVVAQLRAQMAAGGATTQRAPSMQPLVALPVTNGPVPLAAPTPPVLPAPQTPAAPAPTTFQDFMTALTVEVQAGRVPIEALSAACQPLGGVSALNAKPELIPVAWASLRAEYPGVL